MQIISHLHFSFSLKRTKTKKRGWKKYIPFSRIKPHRFHGRNTSCRNTRIKLRIREDAFRMASQGQDRGSIEFNRVKAPRRGYE